MAIINYNVNWDTIPYPYTWVAQDYNGAVYAYRCRPIGGSVAWLPAGTDTSPDIKLYTPPPGIVVPGWRSSIVRRPADTKVEKHTPHKHAANMLKYAEDAAETDAPWRLWEQRELMSDEWFVLENHPRWLVATQYRRIREGDVTITVPRDIVDDLLAWVDPIGVSHDDSGPLATVIRAFKEQLRITAEQN